MYGNDYAAADRQIAKLPPADRARFQKVRKSEELPLPVGTEHLWNWFVELSDGRGEGFAGPAPIAHETLLAWMTHSGASPSPFECRMLLRMDSAWRSEWHRLQPKPQSPAPPPKRTR